MARDAHGWAWSALVRGLGAALIAGAMPVVSAQTPPPPSTPDEWVYSVRPGDNLWTFSAEYLKSATYWRRVVSLNRVRDPLHLAPGTRLRVPFAWLKAQPATARVVEVGGSADIGRAGQAGLSSLASGDMIGPGDAVTTGADGSVTFELADGSRILLGRNARMVFDLLSAYGATGMVDTSLRLGRGRVQARVTPRRGRFRIWTPAATSVVRGTEFRAEFEPDARTARTEVTMGVVQTTAADTTVEVREAFGTTTTEGEAPGSPVSLLPAPDVGPGPRIARRLPARIAAPPVNGAVAYHLEVAPDNRFLSLVFEGTAGRSESMSIDVPDGTYAFRLRGVDVRGLQGLDAVSTLTVDARPEAPVLMAPAVGAVVADERPTFTWSRPAGATGYHFQLAREGSLDAPVADLAHESGATITAPAVLDAGRYAWRVATRADDEEGPFGDWQSFTRRPRPPGPQAALPRADATQVHFAWPAGPEGSRYRLQLACDANFTDIVVDQATSSPGLSIARPPAGTYSMRVKTIEADGYEGDFGPLQSLEIAAAAEKRGFPWRWVLLPVVPVVIAIILL